MMNAHEAAQHNIKIREQKARKLYDEAYLGRGVKPLHIATRSDLPMNKPKNKTPVKRVGGKPWRNRNTNTSIATANFWM
jgi:hypothetical protein